MRVDRFGSGEASADEVVPGGAAGAAANRFDNAATARRSGASKDMNSIMAPQKYGVRVPPKGKQDASERVAIALDQGPQSRGR